MKPAPPLDCHTFFSPADVADVFPGTVKVENYPEGDDACVFKSADTSMVQVSAGNGDQNRAEFMTDRLVAGPQLSPIDGIGDKALYRLDADDTGERVQMYSKKGDNYCSIVAAINHPVAQGTDLLKKLGALCNKVYAAR